MKFIVSVASMDQSRLDGFLDVLEKCDKPKDYRVLVLGTGGNVKINMDRWKLPITFKPLPEKKRYYGEVIFEKVQMAKHLIDEDGIFVNIDDDYFLNQRALTFTERIMNDNPQVNYLCLLRGPGVNITQTEELSGVPFFRHGSSMGGSLITRWPAFHSMVEEFFKEYPLENMFDQDFWGHLERKTGEKNHVHTLVYFSLVQHTNLGSHYQKAMGEHMYAENFDPRMDPFEWIRRAGL
jgi:hypothetical protein